MAYLTFIFVLETIETFEMEKKSLLIYIYFRQLYYDQILLMFYERLMLYWQ